MHQPVFSYKTLSASSAGTYREKGSKFLAFAFPVKDEEEIKRHLEQLRRQYFDARHHCYAWLLGADKSKFRAVDDGEPGHSAGSPILGQIRSHDLTDVLVVVVRYFGGIKLGVGGLVNAYRTAAAEALANSTIIAKDVSTELFIEYGYTCSAEVMRLVKEYNLTILEHSFDERGRMKVLVGLINETKLVEKLNLMKSLKMNVHFSLPD